jgi:hypothetical protein
MADAALSRRQIQHPARQAVPVPVIAPGSKRPVRNEAIAIPDLFQQTDGA